MSREGPLILGAVGAAIENDVGTTPPCAKLTGDSSSGFEATLINDFRLFRFLAENWPKRLLGLLQRYQGHNGCRMITRAFRVEAVASVNNTRLSENKTIEVLADQILSLEQLRSGL